MPSTIVASITRLALVAFLVTLAAPALAGAATLYVDASDDTGATPCGTAEAPCRTIPLALAQAQHGDTIVVAPGTYAGATVTKNVILQGAHAGQSATARAIGTAGATRLTTTLDLRASSIDVDGFELSSPTGAAIRLGAGEWLGSVQLRNNTISGHAIDVQAAFPSVKITGNRFVGAGTGTAIRMLGTIAPSPDASIRDNAFESYAVAVNAQATPGLQFLDNDVADTETVISATLGSTDLIVRGNAARGISKAAIRVAGTVHGITVEQNAFAATGGSVLLADVNGAGTTGVTLSGNDATGFARIVQLQHGSIADAVRARGNRFIVDTPGVTTGPDADLRGNWWGSNAAPATVDGIDVSAQLQLRNLLVAGTVLVGGSSNVSVELSTPLGPAELPQTMAFDVSFATSYATIHTTRSSFRNGVAHSLFTGHAAGVTRTTATLDGVTLAADTTITVPVEISPVPAPAPGAADAKPPKKVVKPLRTSIGVNRGSLRTAASRGVIVVVRASRAGRYEAILTITPAHAKRLGLRSKDSRSRSMYVIGRARGTMKAGARTVRVRLTKRARYAILRQPKDMWLHTEVRFRQTGKRHTVSMIRTNALSRLIR